MSLLVSENSKSYEILKENEEKRLQIIENLNQNSPQYRFFRAEIKLHWALVKMRFGHEVKAAFSIISAYKLLEENQKMFPNFTPNLKYLGVLHVLIGSVPDNFTWAAKLMGLRGNIQQGIKELQIIEADKIFGDEAKFYELFIQAYVLALSESKNQELLKFVEENPDNSAINFLGVAMSVKDNRSEQALKILQKRLSDAAYLPMPILDFYRGDIMLQKGEYSEAISSYSAYLKGFQGKSFLKETYYKMFLACWLNNDVDKAKVFLNKIPKVGNLTAEADKAAQKFYENYLETNILPNKFLAKSRLSFDGGFYQEAWNDLENITENSLTLPKEKAELNYRKGRILQKIANFDAAIIVFQRAILLSEGQDWHFGASSSLQLGYIFQAKNDKLKAKSYFEKALSYKKHDYKNSVDNKARAALNNFL
jgi:tetratricopeptide (TPR) repeat protein